MCDQFSQQLMDDIVAEKVRAGEMFTALDVSREAQRRGCTERHYQIKHVVHECFERGDMGGDYTRTLVRIPGAPIPPWLYHRTTARIRDYGALRRPTRGGGNGCRVDRRSRICVPVRWLRGAGLQPGDAALVSVDPRNSCLVLSRGGRRVARSRTLRTYRVDRDGNVRIAQTTLRKAALVGQAYDIAGDNTRVLIRLLNQPQN